MSKSEAFWDKKAEGYANSPIGDEQSYQKKLAETQRLLSSDMHLLELGCGTGTTAIHHAPYVQHIDAIDISENMLAIGREKARQANIANIDFTRASLTEFNASAGSLDAVLALNVIHLLPDRQAVLAEIARILKPGGIFVASTACLGHSYLRFIRYLLPLGKRLGLLPDVFMLTESELADELKNAGFAIENQWHHGMQDLSVFTIARKITS